MSSTNPPVHTGLVSTASRKNTKIERGRGGFVRAIVKARRGKKGPPRRTISRSLEEKLRHPRRFRLGGGGVSEGLRFLASTNPPVQGLGFNRSQRVVKNTEIERGRRGFVRAIVKTRTGKKKKGPSPPDDLSLSRREASTAEETLPTRRPAASRRACASSRAQILQCTGSVSTDRSESGKDTEIERGRRGFVRAIVKARTGKKGPPRRTISLSEREGGWKKSRRLSPLPLPPLTYFCRACRLWVDVSIAEGLRFLASTNPPVHGLSFNRSQRECCSTAHDTPTET